LACAIYQGLSDDNLDKTVAALVTAVKNSDDILTAASWYQISLHALSDNGRSDVAYKIVNQTTFPSWGNWIGQGATTLWEQWDGSESRNHIMFGDVSAWFYKNLAGIAPDNNQPGFKTQSYSSPIFQPILTGLRRHIKPCMVKLLLPGKEKKNRSTIVLPYLPTQRAKYFLPTE
jgi:alpha-L-rhamnosidase